MRKIYYVGYYDTNESKQNREYYLSATNLMDYLADSIDVDKYKIEYVSMSGTKSKKIMWGGKKTLSHNRTLKKFLSLGKGNSLFARADIHFLRLQMFLYLLFHVHKRDIVLVYHSLNYTEMLRDLRRIKRFNLVLQVCEIYQDVSGSIAEKQKKHEFDLVGVADAFICSNKHLSEVCNKEGKPSVLLYGIYRAYEGKQSGFEDGKIHVVYAGTLDPRKGGAAAAVAAECLDERYHMHLLGFGSDEQIEEMKRLIGEANSKSSATITYDGLLKGKEFDDFLRKCHIGLATQIPDASFAKTSFPSKVLTYLSNGLSVVSSTYEAIQVSPVASCVSFYDEQTPQKIAECIMNTNVENTNSLEVIRSLDENFKQDFANLLNEVGDNKK